MRTLSGRSCYLTLVANNDPEPRRASALPFALSQALSVQSAPNGPCAPPSDVQLKCSYCKNSFCSKPEILEWEASAAWSCCGARRAASGGVTVACPAGTRSLSGRGAAAQAS